ncbi:MAG: ATP-binding protein [Bacteroidaceae bacterium]|nr:ATP-binding protein [Bacteroidaceae bacterium]
MIRNPNDRNSTDKKIRFLLAGYPGIGKSTLALSAPKPLLVDVDHGIDRIEPIHRTPYIQPESYTEVLDDLVHDNVRDFETIVFDTGGKLVSLIGFWAIKNNPKCGQSDGSLSLKGYGVVKREFARLMDYCYYELNKNVIVVFHATEEKDGEETRLRIKVEGGTRNDVWEPMDLGGFVEMRGNNRTIGFSNCERYFAKGTRGINGVWKIPTISAGQSNNFLTLLFEEYNKKNRAEVDEAEAKKKEYDDVMEKARKIIDSVTDADTAMIASEQMKRLEHVLTSGQESRQEFADRIKELGLKYNSETKRYEAK